jgi:hypothetical protein
MPHWDYQSATCWKQAKVERNLILGKKACMRKATAGRKSSMCASNEDLKMLALGFLQYIVMDGEIEMYKYRYLGLIESGRKERKEVEYRGGVMF